MTKQQICTRMTEDHKYFIQYIESLNPEEFLYAPSQKWTTGQHLDHIIRSVSAVRQALTLPKFILKLIFPKANRPSKTYDQLVTKYQSKLQLGGKAGGRFVPADIIAEQKPILTNKLYQQANKLCKRLDHYSEEQLDSFVLPHPLLGKLTLREMLYFTIYHVQHHHRLAIKNLEDRMNA